MNTSSNGAARDTVEELDALIVGGGFAGCYQLMQLRDAGFNVKLYDNAAQIGGIWYWNCYPGARVDSTCPLYQFSREDLWKDWEYTELFPAWTEIRKYFEYVDKKLNLSKDVRLNTRIESARFDQEKNQWIIKTDAGATVRARFFIVCTGFASKPYIPKLEGLESFAGPVAHAGRWPQEGLDFTDKRIGVIGTGSSGVQLAEQASLKAKHLTVFQRTPALALPLRQVKLDTETQKRMKEDYPGIMHLRRTSFAGFDYEFQTTSWYDCTPEERQAMFEKVWEEGAFHPWLGTFREILVDEEANEAAYVFWRKKVHARVRDPEVAEKIAPEKKPIFYGTKRMGLEQWYFDIFNKDNVELADLKEAPIERVTPNGIQTKNKFYELDMILLGTGFDAVTGGVPSIDIHGTQGETLAQHWSKGFRTAFGTASAGFPNLFFIYGPQSPAAVANGPSLAEHQGEWVVACLKYLREHQHNRIDATPEMEAYWLEQVNTIANASLLSRTRSWWFGGNIPDRGLESLYYLGGMPLFLEECWNSAKKGYEGFRLS